MKNRRKNIKKNSRFKIKNFVSIDVEVYDLVLIHKGLKITHKKLRCVNKRRIILNKIHLSIV